MNLSDEPAVGRGRPPQHTRFKKGESGNPKGRPKRQESFEQLARRVLNALVIIQEDGRPLTISKQELVLKQLANKAAAGDPGAIREALKLKQIAEQHPDEVEPLIVTIKRFAPPPKATD